jgi:hypothetical protein
LSWANFAGGGRQRKTAGMIRKFDSTLKFTVSSS